MARKRTTGDGEPYTPDDEAYLADWLADDLALEETEDDEGAFDMEGQIEWAGTIDQNGRDGLRRTRLDQIPLAEIRTAAAELRSARTSGPAQPYKSYRAKGWRSQLRQMLSTGRGREAAEQAGLRPETIRRWQRGRQAPSAASRAKITGAYEQLRNPRPYAVDQARHNLAEAFTNAARTRYGVIIRIRDISHLWFEE